jgi:hypothetical protein
MLSNQSLLLQYRRPQIQNSRCGEGVYYLIRKDIDTTDAYFIAARLWQVITPRYHFQSGYVGMYLVIFALLPHQLMRLVKL